MTIFWMVIVCIVLAVLAFTPSYEDRRKAKFYMDVMDSVHRRYILDQIKEEPEFVALTEQQKNKVLDEMVRRFF